MATDLPQRFIDALQRLESDGDPSDLAKLYGDDATCGNTATKTTYEGPDGARDFWSGYRDSFSEIRSEFRDVVSNDEAAALEWVTTAKLHGGDPVEYEGVTVLEFAGDAITRSTAYFDPRALTGAALHR